VYFRFGGLQQLRCLGLDDVGWSGVGWGFGYCFLPLLVALSDRNLVVGAVVLDNGWLFQRVSSQLSWSETLEPSGPVGL